MSKIDNYNIKSMLAPICLFTYNRLEETKQTIDSLKNNYLASESELYIFSDGPKNEESKTRVEEVREYLKTVNGFKNIFIINAVENKGLSNSIVSGVSEIIMKYEKVIVLEDDLITTTNFLTFMNQALDYYQNDINIQSINGFSLYINNFKFNSDVYFQKRPFSWGWATWLDRWNKDIFNKQMLKSEISSNISILKEFKKDCGNDISEMFMNSINNKNDSWYVRWAYNHFKNRRYSVYPIFSLVENIGFTKAGTHCTNINPYNYKMDKLNNTEFKFIKFENLEKKVTNAFLNYFSLKHKVVVRINLLRTSTGRNKLLSELKMKIKTT